MLTVDRVALDALHPHPQNPRQGDVGAIAESLRVHGQYRPLIVQRSTGYVLAGNHTLQAMQSLGWSDVDVTYLDVDDEQAVRILVVDNRTSDLAFYDDHALAALLTDLAQQTDLALAGTGFDGDDLDRLIADLNAVTVPRPERGGPSLADRFLVPPFSVLDARQGYWQDRKREWLALGIQSELGRPQNVLKASAKIGGLASGSGRAGALRAGAVSNRSYPSGPALDRDFYRKKTAAEQTVGRPLTNDEFLDGYYDEKPGLVQRSKPSDAGNDPTFYWKKQETERRLGRELSTAEFLEDYYDGPDVYVEGTSIFDPVLCEVAYRWFSPDGARVLDPFAGGSVRGIVASRLGREYVGVDLSAAQVEANEMQATSICRDDDPRPRWLVGDARDIPTLVDGDFDLVFSCPPYFDLEQYSDDPADLCNAGSWETFRAAYDGIIGGAAARLRPGRFAVFVVGNVREQNRTGALLDLGAATVDAFDRAGCVFYNDAVLVTAIGSVSLRAAVTTRLRKLARTHQQVLVFLRPPLDDALRVLGPMEAAEEMYAQTFTT